MHNNPVNIIDLSANKVNLEPLFCKQGFRDTKAIFCLLGNLPNPHRTLPAASGCASVPDALTAVPAKEKSPVQNEHYAHTAPDIPSSTALSIFFFLPNFLLMQLLFFLLILFQDFLHNLLSHKPILHFRFGLAVLCMCSSVNGKIGLHGLNKCVSPSFLSQHHSIPVVFENVYVLF